MEDENMQKVRQKEKKFLSATDISNLIGCSESYAYNVIRQLNEEMKANNYIVFRGKINAKYFYQRVGLANE